MVTDFASSHTPAASAPWLPIVKTRNAFIHSQHTNTHGHGEHDACSLFLMRPDKTPFVRDNLVSVPRVNSSGLSVQSARLAHLEYALGAVPPSLRQQTHLFLEFGVRKGFSISHLANITRTFTWHGFDSFHGLPPATSSDATRQRIHWGPGTYSTHGRLPLVPPNVRLHAGWFNETVYAFLGSVEGQGASLAFAHFDADLYDSTATVLTLLARSCRLRVGSVLAFDELFGSPAVEQHEWRALNDVARQWGLQFRFLSYMAHEKTAFGRAAVQLTHVECLRTDVK